MIPVRRLLVALALVLPLLSGGPGRAAPTPAGAVETLQVALLGIMREASTLGFAGRAQRMAPVVAQTFDMRLIARGSVGRYWARLDEGARARLVALLERLTVATYAARFKDYTGEQFRILGQRAGPRGTVLVQSELVKSDGEPVRIDYLVHQGDDGWRILDVYLKGVYSELALRRSEYTSVLRRAGFQALARAIEGKIAAFEREGAG